MITNQFISPHSLLRPFVSNYILATSNGLNTTFSSYWAASNEVCFIFYLANQPNHKNDHVDSILSGKRNCFVGLLTRYNGVVDFNGKYHTFIIQFELNGVNKIFGLSMVQFTDKIYSVEDVFGKKMSELHDQLLNAANIQQMASYADTFLLSFFNERTKKSISQDCITFISKAFYDTSSLSSVAEYASMVNMSVRNFERKFLEQTGIMPKLHIKLLRFNEAIKIKTINPCKSFTAIAHECGYFDQAHFIKEFKTFTGSSPKDFFTKDNKLTRPRIDIKQSSEFTFTQLNNQLLHEEFVSVQRTN
jgi:AraC-like DNA-binding protein